MLCLTGSTGLFFSVIDRNDFDMTNKNWVISIRMSENTG